MDYGVNILIKAVETATAPIRKVRDAVAKTTEPVAKFAQRMKKLGEASGLTRLRQRIKELHEPLKKSWEEAGKLVTRLGLLGGGMLGGAIAAFKSLFLNVAVGNENLARSMRNVVGSADGAKAAMAAVQQQMRGLPVDVNDAAQAYMRLKSEGIAPSADLMKRLADVAGHTGKSLAEAANVLANMKNGQTGGLAEILGGNVKQAGNYIVAEFTDATGKVRRMAVKQGQNLAQNAKAMRHLFDKATEAKGMTGGAERFGQSWQGMMARAKAAWTRFVSLVMDSGPFKILKEKFQGILAAFDELENGGGLQALAEKWAQTFCDAIESLWESGKALAAWFKSDFVPAFQQVKEFLGGWGGVFKAVAAVMAGPFLLSLVNTVAGVVSVATALAGPLMKAFALAKVCIVALGKALLTTPVGWIIAGIAAVAGAVYLIYKNWSKISAFFQDVWQKVRAVFTGAWEALTGYLTGKITGIVNAFDKGFLQGMLELFLAFHPLTWITDAMNALTQYLFGFSLKDAGSDMVNSLLDGMKSMWDSVVSWLYGAWKKLTGGLPDIVKKKLGVQVAAQATGPAAGAPRMAASHAVFPQGPPTGAARVMANGAAAAPGRDTETKVRTEVVITGENLPPGLTVSTPKSQADNTRLDCGYMMAGAR